DRPKLIAALFYAGFAKRVEPLATAAWHQQGEGSPQPAEVESLATGGKAALERAKKWPFLRRRYAMQLVRLHFYARDYAGAVGAYEQHRADLAQGTAEGWRALSAAAGALNRLGKTAEANHGFAAVFAGYPVLAPSALLSFRPQEETDWRRTLELAKSP